jgi:nitroreductase
MDEDRNAGLDPEAFRRIVETRRSVRRFDGQPVPEAVMRECLRLATLAPNSSNLQPWHFYWVRDAGAKARLAEACLSQSAATTAGDLVVVAARTGTWRKNSARVLSEWPSQPPPKVVRQYYGKLTGLLYNQGPLGVLGRAKGLFFHLVGWFRPAPRFPFGRGPMRVWAEKSGALACQNLMLALRAHGYDTCPLEGFDGARVRRQLRLPGDASVVMIVAAGRAEADGIYGPQWRLPMNEVIEEI